MVRRKDAFFGIHLDLHTSRGDTEQGADVTEDMVYSIDVDILKDGMLVTIPTLHIHNVVVIE